MTRAENAPTDDDRVITLAKEASDLARRANLIAIVASLLSWLALIFSLVAIFN